MMTPLYKLLLSLSARFVAWLLFRLAPEAFPVERTALYTQWKNQLRRFCNAQ